jgi:hypothetical protein
MKKTDRKFLASVIILVSVSISTIILIDYYYKNSAQNNYALGFQMGTENGITIGYDDGYAKGENAGYDDGYAKGVVCSSDNAYDLGEVAGFNDGYAKGEEAGYAKGLIDGVGTGFTIRDPTAQEMIDFISSDTTDQNEYTEDYICFDYAAEVKNNAFLEGYRCAFVYVSFPNSDHGMVCFDTVDQGLIFIEPQDDRILPVIVGESLFGGKDWDDTIVDYRIIW